MIELRWVCWDDDRQLEYRTRQPGATEYGEWQAVPEFDATHPAVTPAKVIEHG